MNSKTRSLGIAVALTLLVALFAASAPVQVKAGGHVEVIKTFDEGENAEGVAVDKRGNLYVCVNPTGQIWKITPKGEESVFVDFGPSPHNVAVLGLAVDAPGNLYVAYNSGDEYHGVYRVTRDGTRERLPGTEAIWWPNALVFDQRGNLYVSDTWLGAIWRIPRGGSAELWIQDPMLEGDGHFGLPTPFGANGIAYRHGSIYVANMEKRLIVDIPVLGDGSAGNPDSIGTPGYVDGIALDVHGNIYAVLFGQSRLVRIEPASGEVTAELATAADGLDEPASLVFGTGKGDRQSIFVSNYASLPAWAATWVRQS
jgi:sugar lactone lactonase YvrE